jgi:hypothetical protein
MDESIYEKTKGRLGLVNAGIITLQNKTVEIYGEIINKEENLFWEEVIQKNLLHKYFVICTKMREESKMKGSKYIFETLKKTEEINPPVFDGRLHYDLPCAIEEKAFLDYFEGMATKEMTNTLLIELKKILTRLSSTLTQLLTMEKTFREFYKDWYTSIIESAQLQHQIICKSVEKHTKENDFINGLHFFKEGVANKQVLAELGIFLTKNIRRLCCAFDDFAFLIIIEESNASKIALFTQASRVHRFLTMIFKNRSKILCSTQEDVLELTADGLFSEEIKFLKQLE